MSCISVLMVAEKPSICTSIAQALSKGQMESRGRTPPVHEFRGTFLNQAAFFRVTSVVGHIFSTDFPAQYQNWDAVNPADLFDAPIISTPEGKGGIIKHLEREASGMDYLVLWLDCDREGENICFEVIRCVSKHMKKGPTLGRNILRARFSAVTAKDIEKAMRSLVAPNENESKAVEARQEMDLKIGVAFSRFQTRYFQGKYGDLDSAVISYGPCQTPTLGFCVERHDEIKTFTPEPFWSLDVSVEVRGSGGAAEGARGGIVRLDWTRKRVFDEDVAQAFLHTLRTGEGRACWTDLLVASVSTSETRRTRPQAMNTVTMLKLASSQLGIGPQQAMRAAEHLYLSGYLSYPRTESTAYPSTFDFRGTLNTLRGHPQLGSYAADLLSGGSTSARHGKDEGDHPPITPVDMPHLSTLSSDEARIFDLVVKHFLATISRDARFLVTKATFVAPSYVSPEGKGEVFVAVGREELDPGFTAVYGRQRACAEDVEEGEGEGEDDYGDVLQQLPSQLRPGMQCRIASASLHKGFTSIPGYLTESELISKMEKNGIGTDASIPTHINNIIVRNYVTLGPGRTLVPTALGVVLVHGYYRIDVDLVLPNVRATIEKFCDMIAKGAATKEQVVSHSLRNFQRKFVYFSEHVGAMDSLFEASFSPLAATGKFLSKCGKCLRYMRYIPLKPQRLYCPNCEETHALPQNGTIKLYKEIRCPLDNFELVLFSLGNSATAQGKSFPLCPYCYSHPPSIEAAEADDAEGGQEESKVGEVSGGAPEKGRKKTPLIKMGCNQCEHPSCKQSMAFNGMCPCPNTIEESSSSAGGSGKPCPGTLVLDINSKPNWKLACNQCNTLLRFHANIHHITPLPRKTCDECGTRIATFDFNKLHKSPDGNQEPITGCIVCSDVLNGLTEIITGRSVHLTLLRQIRFKRNAGGRGRGRGRGRGGRGGRGAKGDVKMSFSDF